MRQSGPTELEVEVVGTRFGKYYAPAFAGVAFSRNDFRWSPRVQREDGLLRLVPGLGTRAVDRLGDDYPVLISPGQPERCTASMEFCVSSRRNCRGWQSWPRRSTKKPISWR